MATVQHTNLSLLPGGIREVIDICIANDIQHKLVCEYDQWEVKTPNIQSITRLLGGLRHRSEVPIALKSRGCVEEYQFRDTEHFGINRRAWWGFPDDLIELGVATRDQLKRIRRWSKCGEKEGVGGWSTAHAPSGRVLFEVYDKKPAAWFAAKQSQQEAIQRAQRLGEIIEPVCTDYEGSTCWFGRKQDLIAQGICEESRFPVGKKRQAYEYDAEPRWQIQRVSGEYFKYSVYKAESEARPDNSERGPEYQSPEAHHQHVEDWISQLAFAMRALISNERELDKFGAKTLSFDKQTIRRVCEAVELIEQTVQAGSVGWTREQKARMEKAVSSKSDASFQSFLAGVVAK